MEMMSKIFKLLFIIITTTLAIPLIFITFSWIFNSGDSISYLIEQNLLFLYIKNSLIIAFSSSILALFIGVISAYLISSTDIFCKNILRWFLILPIAIPSYVAAIIYDELFSSFGPIQNFIRNFADLEYGQYWFIDISSIGGAIFILAITLYPYIYLLSFNAFKTQSKQSIESAKLLGMNNFEIFYRLRLLIARPMIFVGVFLVMMESLADFGVVSLFGISSFTTAIYRSWNDMYDPVAAAQISSILLIFVIIILFFEKYSRKRARYYNLDQYCANNEIIKLPKYLNIISCIFCLLVTFLGFILPFATIVYWSFGQLEVFFDQYVIDALINSIILGLAVSMISVIIGLLMAFIMRYNNKNIVFSTLTFIASSGYAIPGSVVAVSILLLLIKLQNNIFDGSILLIGTIFAIIWACSFRFLTISYNNISSSLNNITPIMDDVAKILGRSKFSILTKLHIPAIRQILLISFLLIFVDTIKELPATLLLRPFNFNSLAIRTYELANDELIQYSAPTALLMIVISLLPIWFINKYFLMKNK
jgi:iron(III) transport system permease protein